jgi:hypothetical protein
MTALLVCLILNIMPINTGFSLLKTVINTECPCYNWYQKKQLLFHNDSSNLDDLFKNCSKFNKFLDHCAFSFLSIIGKARKIILLKKAAKKTVFLR